MLLTALASRTPIAGFQPQNNKQAYLAYLNGLSVELPAPRTREEMLLYNLCANGVGGGFEITDASALFQNNYRLENVSDIFPFIKNCTNFNNCFQNSTNLTSFKEKLDCAEAGADTTRMFMGCSNLAGEVDLDHAPLRTQEYMFGGCNKLEGILNVNLSSAQVYQFALQGSTTSKKALKRFTYSPLTTNAVNVNVAYSSFERENAVEMFKSLPAVTSSRTITLTGNPCVTNGTLTATDKLIAENKGWTIVT